MIVGERYLAGIKFEIVTIENPERAPFRFAEVNVAELYPGSFPLNAGHEPRLMRALMRDLARRTAMTSWELKNLKETDGEDSWEIGGEPRASEDTIWCRVAD